MPYSDKEVDDFWASIDEAASNAPTAPYSHAKVRELIRVAWKLKSENARLSQQLAELRTEYENYLVASKERYREREEEAAATWALLKHSEQQNAALRTEVETLKANQLPQGWICHP